MSDHTALLPRVQDCHSSLKDHLGMCRDVGWALVYTAFIKTSLYISWSCMGILGILNY